MGISKRYNSGLMQYIVKLEVKVIPLYQVNEKSRVYHIGLRFNINTILRSFLR